MKKPLCLVLCVMLCALLTGCSWFFPKATPDLQPHLIAEEQAEFDPVRPVDARRPQAVEGRTRTEQIESLGQVVADGFKPTFDQGLDPDVQRIYDNAVKILDRYILNDFDTYARIHAIHDYLAFSVSYDAQLYQKYLEGKEVTDEHPSFHLDGALLEKNAVCDGFSKAFAFLCNLEGIECVRILGAFDSRPHAWNKVEMDGKWYNVDVTMDKAYYALKSATAFQVHHGYFLLSDQSIKQSNYGRHTFADGMNPSDEYAHVDYPYYESARVSIGDVRYESVVTDTRQLVAIFQTVAESKRAVGKLELKLEIAGANTDNATVFDEMIAAAYGAVKGDFAYDPDKGYTPYFRFSNGVFVFLIYQ